MDIKMEKSSEPLECSQGMRVEGTRRRGKDWAEKPRRLPQGCVTEDTGKRAGKCRSLQAGRWVMTWQRKEVRVTEGC